MGDSDAAIPARLRAIADTLPSGSQELHDLANDVERLLGSLAEVRTLADDLCECDDGNCVESTYRVAILGAIQGGWLRGSRETVPSEVWARAAQVFTPTVAVDWLTAHNQELGAVPMDLLRLGRIGEVMAAIDVTEAKAWGS